MRKQGFFSALVLILIAISVYSQPAQRSNGQVLKIPFELYGNTIFLPVKVNNSQPLVFLLDSGASYSVLNRKLADKLNLKPKVIQRNKADNSLEIGLVEKASLALSNVELSNLRLVVGPLDVMEPIAGHKIDGILGYDIFNRYTVEIDYKAKFVTLHEPSADSYLGSGEVIAIKMKDNTPFVKAKVVSTNGSSVEDVFLVDTGATRTITFARPFVEKHQFLQAGKTIQTIGLGFEGESKQRIGRIKALQIGRYVINNPIAAFSQAEKGDLAEKGYGGEIGGEFLKRFRVVLDYKQKRLVLEPNEYLADAEEFSMSGIIAVTEGADFKVFKVYRVLENSAASEAGLRENDVITAIDETPIASLTAAQIQSLFKQENREYTLHIKRSETQTQVKIKLKKLI